MELAKQKLNSMVIDYTNGFRDEHLESEYTDFVQPQTNLLVHKPIELNPFERQKQKVAGVEIYDKAHDVASRVASVFNSVYSDIGSQQLPTLIRTIEEGIKSFGEGYNFDKLLEDLIESGKHGEALANKLYPLAKANLFSFSQNADGWNGVYKSPKPTTRIIQMATLSRDIWLLATEFILWDLYSYSCANGDKNTPLPVILDEVQNLDQKLDSPLGKMLTEGRKYGLSLILATQTLSNLKKDEQDRLFQAAHKLFFAPANTEVHSYAKLLELAVPGTTKKGWLEELANLKKGECISVGLHLNKHGVPEQGAKVVKVSSLSSRLA
jgi:DNA helicase HerA-like ATPase